MSQPYVGECRLVGFNFAPVNWLMCQGQVLPISQYETLFNLIGTTYGGDGQQTFQLPDLRGRSPLHQGSGLVLAQIGGSENVTLNVQQLPIHSHGLQGSGANGTSNNFAGGFLAQCPTPVYRSNQAPTKALNLSSVSNSGSSVPHNNLQPYLTMTWIISLFGVYPSQS